MEVVGCKICGKLFNWVQGTRMCPACMKLLEEKFTEVKKFVRENPSSDINTISKEMKVSVRQLNQWVREERLVFSADSPVGIPCEGCGITIKSGKYCDKCKNNLGSQLRDAAGLNKPKEPEVTRQRKGSAESKMRFLD